ncbi:hypothetical protein RR46_05258 [Papilio xuthus]|uniref:Uncharacterized protein n=1 Tax=Papilio xuthus TaxID=66420 RepID=A0A194Q630_PAPXU|nr:hypothetical protein RR46_05258 [Papilio xuthus]
MQRIKRNTVESLLQDTNQNGNSFGTADQEQLELSPHTRDIFPKKCPSGYIRVNGKCVPVQDK